MKLEHRRQKVASWPRFLFRMGPVVEMKSPLAKLFSSFYALYSGVAFLSITAVFFAPLIHRLLHILHVEEEKPGT